MSRAAVPFDAPDWRQHRGLGDLTDTELHQTWRERTQEDTNDFIICIAPSSRTPISGTGKTTLGVQLAEYFDQTERGFIARDKAALNADRVSHELIPNCERKSAILFDESQGTLGDDGVDSRRGMASSVIDMARAAAQFRKRQHTLILISQSTDWIDGRMMELIDRLILIQEKNAAEGWARAITFDHYKRDLPGGYQGERTPSIEDIYWAPCEPDNRNYAELDRMKEEADGSDDDDGEPGLSSEEKEMLARELYEHSNLSQAEIASNPKIDRSQSWVSQVVNSK